MYGDYKTDISFVVAQGTLLWQAVKFRRCSQTSRGTTFTLYNGLAESFNGNNHATSHPNLVNFHPVISEFTLLKCAIFAAIRPQFENDLHSSR